MTALEIIRPVVTNGETMPPILMKSASIRRLYAAGGAGGICVPEARAKSANTAFSYYWRDLRGFSVL